MKRCFKCGTEKPLDEFYRHPQMSDGHLGKCKECAKADVRANRSEKIDYYTQYDRVRWERPERRSATLASYHRSKSADPERYREYGRRWAASNPEKIRQTHLNYRAANPEKRAAHTAVAHAVRAGRLVRQPCEVCGATKSEAHHEDYSRQLDVRWLCRRHHAIADRHRREREAYGTNAA